MGSRAKLRDYFLSNLGRVLSSDELRAAAGGITEWARRVRELRNEEGFQILTNNDRANLKPGQYLLQSATPQPAFERGISKETRAHVLLRNGRTCQMCGAEAGEPHFADPSRKVQLHMGHVIDKSMGGSDDAANLRAICSVCNEGASNVAAEPPSAIKLLAQVRRARNDDQMRVLQALAAKFPDEVARLMAERPLAD